MAKAVLLAGGLGTRLSEETQLKPKPMVEIGGKPIIMIFNPTPLHGAYTIDLEKRGDDRGFFARVFARKSLETIVWPIILSRSTTPQFKERDLARNALSAPSLFRSQGPPLS